MITDKVIRSRMLEIYPDGLTEDMEIGFVRGYKAASNPNINWIKAHERYGKAIMIASGLI